MVKALVVLQVLTVSPLVETQFLLLTHQPGRQ